MGTDFTVTADRSQSSDLLIQIGQTQQTVVTDSNELMSECMNESRVLSQWHGVSRTRDPSHSDLLFARPWCVKNLKTVGQWPNG